MLLGTYAPKLDEKGRLIMPAKFRDELADGVVLTRGQDRCIYVFSAEEFEGFHDRIRQAPVSSKQARDYLRLLLAGAHQERPDAQHRVTLPPALRAYAGLERELTVNGVGGRIEIWDTATWEAYYAGVEDEFVNVAEEVIPGLL